MTYFEDLRVGTRTDVGSHTFTNGLVLDSAVYPNLTEVSPVQSGDSHITGMQHMGVIKDFNISYTIDSTVPAPVLTLVDPNTLQWRGVANTTYSVQLSSDLTNWSAPFSVTSSSTTFGFTNQSPDPTQTFYRVTYP